MAPAVERVFLGSPLAAAGGRVIVAPFQLLTEGEDNLRIEAWNSLAGARLAVHGRWWDLREGRKPIAKDYALTADRTRNVFDEPLGKGYLVNLVAFASSGAPQIGQTFVKVSLIGGLTGATLVLGTLLQGYVNAQQALAWPGSPIALSTEGPAAVRIIVGTDPAAGVQVSETVPTGAQWELVSFLSTFVTDAVAGSRFVRLVYRSGGSVFLGSQVSATVGASSTTNFVWFIHGLGYDALGGYNTHVGPIPPGVALPAGATIETDVQNMSAGDNWGAPAFAVREYLTAA